MASRPTRNTGATDTSTGATADMIDVSEPLNDSFLMSLAKQLGANYMEFGVWLGLKGNKVRQIISDNRDAIPINFTILETWRNNMTLLESAGVMYTNLREALHNIERIDLEEQVQQMQSSTGEAAKAGRHSNTERQHDKEEIRELKAEVKEMKTKAQLEKIRRLTEEVEALKMKVPGKPTPEEQGSRPKVSQAGKTKTKELALQNSPSVIRPHIHTPSAFPHSPSPTRPPSFAPHTPSASPHRPPSLALHHSPTFIHPPSLTLCHSPPPSHALRLPLSLALRRSPPPHALRLPLLALPHSPSATYPPSLARRHSPSVIRSPHSPSASLHTPSVTRPPSLAPPHDFRLPPLTLLHSPSVTHPSSLILRHTPSVTRPPSLTLHHSPSAPRNRDLTTISCSNVCRTLAGDIILVYGENIAFLTVSAMTETKIKVLKATLEDEDGSKSRILHVLSLLRQYEQPELWRDVSSDILEDGELDVSNVMSSAQLPDLTFLLASGEVTDVISLK
ncbi:hypothetical protein LSAT2_019268 [Lamellibrachia satsuma]|nr:hypothetical protein LSAT2_019268 [Lamellibrachia satsuma]